MGLRWTIWGAAAMLAGCATEQAELEQPVAAGDIIRFSAGPCFGVCPVYSLRVTPDGSGLLEPVGQRVWPEFTHEIHSTLEVFGMKESQSRSRRAAEAADTSRGANPPSDLAAEPSPAAWGHQGSLFD